MYGLAYVLIPTRFHSLQEELDRTLAPFVRGGEESFPREKLAFDDVTDDLLRLHGTKIRYDPDGSVTADDKEANEERRSSRRTFSRTNATPPGTG